MVARNVWFSHLQKAPSQAQVGIFTEEAKQCRGTLGGKIQKESGKSCHPFFARFSGNWLIFVENQDYEALHKYKQEHLVLVNLKNLPLLFDVTAVIR